MWVSESTISQHEQEKLDLELDYGIDVPCVEWSQLWFSAPTRLNQILEQDLIIKKYHEVVNIAITDVFRDHLVGNTHRDRAC